MKLGVHEGFTNRAKVAELPRFFTSKSVYVQISLKEYIDRMKESQNGIYYFTGESITQVSSSPFLETLQKKGLGVLYMVNPVDELCVQQLKEFDCKELKSTTKLGLDIEGEDEKKELEELKAGFRAADEAHEGGAGRQSGEGHRVLPHGSLDLRAHHL